MPTCKALSSSNVLRPSWSAPHAMWAICVVPILLLPTFLISIALGTVGVAVFFIVALSVLIAYTRTLQMVAYLDLRMRHEHFDRELLDAWTRNRRV